MVGIEDNLVFRHFGNSNDHRRLTFAAIGLQLHADFWDNAFAELAVINFDHPFREMRPVSFIGKHRHCFGVTNSHINNCIIKALDHLIGTNNEFKRVALA